MQALYCLSPTLVIGPGDQSPGEFTGRPDIRIDKGTDAQHRQVVKPAPLDPAPKRRPHRDTKQKKTDISNPGVGRDIGSKAGGLFPACYRFKTCF
ncbi:hypothetical protein N879_08225 [Alcaligenes sp. EGD-AK7]|nr:hypothetical protein C660_12409 [Alcaligenes sp. HPC1271]ERI33818.1 hypothetical protein N879_08225 [Alcaligenes sp. EGD-AK7]